MNWYKKAQQLDLPNIPKGETDEDRNQRAAEEYMDKTDEERLNILREFQEAKKKRRAKWNAQPWSVIPSARLIKIWTDYARDGVVRDERGMEEIAEKVIANIARLDVNTVLVGHTTQTSPDTDYAEDFEYYGIKTEKDKERLQMFIQDDKFSDYALGPLQQIAMDLLGARTAEEKLLLVDRALNIVHQRGDIAACFVEGGRDTLGYLAKQGVQLSAKNRRWYKKAQSLVRLWLDDERDPKDPQIQKDFRARGDEIWVKTVEDAINYLSRGNVRSISFDNDLGTEKEGRHLANWIEEQAYHKKMPRLEWSVHSQNVTAKKQIIITMTNADRYWNENRNFNP